MKKISFILIFLISIQKILSQNIQNLPYYPFDKLRALLRNTRVNKKVTDMSIGQPMHSVPSFIKEIIYKGQDKWNNYPPLAGIPALQKSYLRWLKNRFNIHPPDYLYKPHNIFWFDTAWLINYEKTKIKDLFRRRNYN